MKTMAHPGLHEDHAVAPAVTVARPAPAPAPDTSPPSTAPSTSDDAGLARAFVRGSVVGSVAVFVLLGGLTLAGAMIVGLIGLNLQTYAALSKERLAGQVVLKKVGDHNFTASLDLADDGKLRGKPVDFQITGERVHISGPVVKFKPWANVIGMDSLFKVSEIYGTYVDPNCTNTYTPRRETTEECNSGDFFGCLGTSWKLLKS